MTTLTSWWGSIIVISIIARTNCSSENTEHWIVALASQTLRRRRSAAGLAWVMAWLADIWTRIIRIFVETIITRTGSSYQTSMSLWIQSAFCTISLRISCAFFAGKMALATKLQTIVIITRFADTFIVIIYYSLRGIKTFRATISCSIITFFARIMAGWTGNVSCIIKSAG